MANRNEPRGFTPVMFADGTKYSGQANRYYKPAGTTIIGVGDPVVMAADSTGGDGYPAIARSALGAAITGVVVAIGPNLDNLKAQGSLLAAEAGVVLVADDPNLLFEVQEGGTGTALALADIGQYIDVITVADANTVIGRSVQQLDKATVGTDTATWRIERLDKRVGNELGLYCKWLVAATKHTNVNASAANRTEI